jgi:hypothetical protein
MTPNAAWSTYGPFHLCRQMKVTKEKAAPHSLIPFAPKHRFRSKASDLGVAEGEHRAFGFFRFAVFLKTYHISLNRTLRFFVIAAT